MITVAQSTEGLSGAEIENVTNLAMLDEVRRADIESK